MRRLAAGQAEGEVPPELHGNRAATVIFQNLEQILAGGSGAGTTAGESKGDYGGERLRLVLAIDRVMREQAPAGWKGDQAREAQVLNALFPLMGRNRAATQALFDLVKNMPGY